MALEFVNGDHNDTEQPAEEPASGEKSSSEEEEKALEEQNADSVFQISVKLPHKPYQIPVTISTQEQVQDLRNSIVEFPDTFQYSCFHLEFNGSRINDFVELSEVKELAPGAEMKLIEDPYTEKEARMHMIRVRDLIGAAGDRVDTLHGISAGLSLHDSIVPPEMFSPPLQNGKRSVTTSTEDSHALSKYDFDAPASIQTILPQTKVSPPKTVKSICVSAWNPPPHYLRQKGHLLYLQLTTNEGEQFQITSHVSGFFVNKSSNSKFDPYPRPQSKSASAHSLLALIEKLSPSFQMSFSSLQEYNNRKDPLANFQITNIIPANPWLVPAAESSLLAHQPDLTRTQETYLMSGIENAETLRDWNEEFQSTRELPKETIQDRVFRERITSKLFADYTDAAARGAVMVARGEVAPLNPTENRDAQIFVYNNVFFSYGADGVGTFTSEGGDDAARVAVGKDVTGIRVVNQLDIDGLFTPGTVVVDYLGKRLVGQSIVPGIFKQREPGENQIDYGGVEGRDVVAENEAFVPVFSKLSKHLRVKKHDVWDKEGKKHTLEGSVETKGLLGTDGRKYVLDLYRLTPLDITWIEEYWSDVSDTVVKPPETNYPHRMTVLRPELMETYWRSKMGEFVKAELERRRHPAGGAEHVDTKVPSDTNGNAESKAITNGDTQEHDETGLTATGEKAETERLQERVDISDFDLAFNPDVFCGQAPRADEEKEQLVRDEKEVRSICDFLRQNVISELVSYPPVLDEHPLTVSQVHDLREGEVGFPMDGHSLARLLHKRGINIRYLGKLATLAKEQSSRLEALNALSIQEMIARSFKHIANHYMKGLPSVFVSSCLAHLLNCLLGADFNQAPKACLDEELQAYYTNADWSFGDVDIQTLRAKIQAEVHLRYRYTLDQNWADNLKHIPLLREIALKLGLQITAKDYQFGASPKPLTNGSVNGVNHHTNGVSSRKKKKNGDHELASQSSESLSLSSPTTFSPDDLVNIIPVVKDACPKSTLADEALEAGKMSMMQNQKEIGQELLLESLSLHEQIYGVLHPEVARMYHQLSMLYYQLDEKVAAVELARKAVYVSERTLGVDSNETILSYLNLGLFEHGNGNTKIALIYMKHALELWKIIYGLGHPDSITTINNAAVMLQTLKHYHDSRIWFETSLTICEEVSGRQSVNTATLCFQLAQALALDQEAKAAVNRMRDAYSIFLSKLGPDDRNTKESESWLEQLTQNAVSIAKHAKDVQARKLRRIHFTSGITLGTRPQPQVGQSSTGTALGGDPRELNSIDSRSVDELLRFIEGGGETSKRSPAKKRSSRGNPKRRGGLLGNAV
ncbi:Intracellular distribution of mitochondria [Xylographa soralifera]|nr:Intracellular distribution of mitochondria [Xylographa soralifera]